MLTIFLNNEYFADNTTDGMENDLCCNIAGKTGKKANEVSLRPFGLAAYKMQGTLWMNPESDDQEKFINLFDAADSWLKQLRVQHHDFNYFNTHSM